MNFIQKKIDKKIQELEILGGPPQEVKMHHKAKIEYFFYLILGYLWNKNFSKLSNIKKKTSLEKLEQLMLGRVIGLIKELDTEEEFSTLLKQLEQYNTLRIDSDGHAFTYEDGISNYLQEIKTIADNIEKSRTLFFKEGIDFILVLKKREGLFVGKRFLPIGESEIWTCPEKQFTFELGHTYALILIEGQITPKYFDLTPFVHTTDEGEFYILQSVVQKSSGSAKYNRLIKTGQIALDWDKLAKLYQEYTNISKRIVVSKNKTILNRFTPNYSEHTYINIGENRQKIVDFLSGATSGNSVCANMWGHGGVGKTATIQNIVLELAEQSEKVFNCIIFLSNKDRFYNIYQDENQTIDKSERVTTYEDLIVGINQVLTESDKAIFDEEPIINYTHGRILIIIDDFETFEKDDQHKINDFIKKLKPQNHKVIITTRATIRIGTDDIIFNELNNEDTVLFLSEVSSWNSPRIDKEKLKQELIPHKEILRQITQGKPLRIWQFAVIQQQVGDLQKVISHFKNAKSSALNDFFYGRYYDYFTSDAKDIFVVMGQLEYEDDLIAPYDKVKYAVIWAEDNEDRFTTAISELQKLRVIEEIDDKLFKIWDKDILRGMKTAFQERSDAGYKGGVNQRVQQVNKKNLYDTDEALLAAAKENKELSKSLEEIKRGFRQIINRESSSNDLKLRALIELVNYYRINLGSSDLAFKELQNYERVFNSNIAFIKLYSLVCVEEGNLDKSIELLSRFLIDENKLSKEEHSELIGLLITRKRSQLKKELENSNDIAVNIKRSEEVIRRYGEKFFDEMRNIKFSNKGMRANAETGLRHLADLCIHTNNYSLAAQICDYGVNNSEQHFRAQFSKLRKEIPVNNNLNVEQKSFSQSTLADLLPKDVVDKLQVNPPQSEKLSGLKVLGKIELPDTQKATSVAKAQTPAKIKPQEGKEYMGKIKRIHFEVGFIESDLDQDLAFHKSRVNPQHEFENLKQDKDVMFKVYFEKGKPSLDKHGNYKASEVRLK